MKRFIVTLGALALWMGAIQAQPPGGPFGRPPQPGEILPGFLQDVLSLTPEQKKQVETLQKEIDAKLGKILTTEQKKQLDDMRQMMGGPMGGGPGGFGGGPGGFGGGPGGFGGGGAVGGLDNAKKLMKASDEEWKVILPKLQKVIAARQVLTPEPRGGNSGFGGMRMGGGPGGPMGGGGAGNAITQAQDDLKSILTDPKHAKADVEEKIAAVRKARQKARGELDAAEKDLLLLVTADQEAALISLGYLD